MSPLYTFALDGDADVFVCEALIPAIFDFFSQHVDGFAQELRAVLQSDLILQLLHAVDAVFLHLIGYLVRISSRRGAGALGVRENMNAGELDFFQGLQSFLEILFCLSREADDEVGGERETRDFFPELGNQSFVFRQPVVAIHAFQHAVGAGLDGKMQVAAHLRLVLDDLNQFFRQLYGLDGPQADAEQIWDLHQFGYQRRERCAIMEILAVIS